MKKSKKEIKSRILSLSKRKAEHMTAKTSEITRNLFSDVWRDHLDEVRNMAGELKKLKSPITISSEKNPDRKKEPNEKIKKPARLSLVNNK